MARASAGERTRVSVPAREADGKHARDGRGRVGVEAADVEPNLEFYGRLSTRRLL